MSVFKNNITSFFNSPFNLAMVFLLPFIFIQIFIFGQADTIPTNVAIIDNDNTEFTQRLIENINKNCQIVQCSQDEVMDKLINTKIDYAITIDKGYTKALFSGEEATISERYFISEEKLYPLRTSINTYVNSAKSLFDIAANEDEFYDMLANIYTYDVVYETDIVSLKSANNIVIVLGFMIQFIIYSTIIVAACIVVEKENNVTTRILASSKPLVKYLLEHFMSYLVIEAIIVVVLMTTLRVVYSYSFSGNFFIVIIMFLLFAIATVAMSLMVLSICRKSKIFYWVMICLSTPIIMLGGCYFEITTMPQVIQNISKFLPTRWIMDIARDLLLRDSKENVLITVVVLVTFTIVYLSISRIGLKRMLTDK